MAPPRAIMASVSTRRRNLKESISLVCAPVYPMVDITLVTITGKGLVSI